MRGQFACIAVVVDLEKPLTSQLRVNGRLQRMKFEALPEVCFSCGKYGHLKISYLSSVTDRSSVEGAEASTKSMTSDITPVKLG